MCTKCEWYCMQTAHLVNKGHAVDLAVSQNKKKITIATALNIPTKYKVLDDVLNRIEFLRLCCLLITPQKVMYTFNMTLPGV